MSVDVRYIVFGGITSILLFGTLYSVAYDTYLDTSHPRTVHRVFKWGVETTIWLVFTSCFGGECTVSLQSGAAFTVPYEYCFTRTAISQETHPFLFVGSFAESSAEPSLWGSDDRLTVIPRLRKGHDVSGHVFLLTMSVLFLVDQIRVSLRAKTWSLAHALYFHSPFEKFTGYLLGVAGYMVTLLY
ncbi:hypothetical protein BDR07DRAFT_1432501 [Suillus spraguei]|nr:hypothetical protein BDR07DRAFT_1432501 [Suillus spraguei]